MGGGHVAFNNIFMGMIEGNSLSEHRDRLLNFLQEKNALGTARNEKRRFSLLNPSPLWRPACYLNAWNDWIFLWGQKDNTLKCRLSEQRSKQT